jgi:hypothetical protein
MKNVSLSFSHLYRASERPLPPSRGFISFLSVNSEWTFSLLSCSIRAGSLALSLFLFLFPFGAEKKKCPVQGEEEAQGWQRDHFLITFLLNFSVCFASLTLTTSSSTILLHAPHNWGSSPKISASQYVGIWQYGNPV